MGQFVTRIDADLAAAVDELVEKGIFDSRSDAVRKALAEVVDRERREEIGRQIIEGYKRFPETEAEMKRAEQNAINLVNEEPW
ncbi:MAG: ribbon-helix-helix domain-containing protein [Actinomycetota bacterium]|nr:ribbon-helix-helix domain-containing protein [Actinomycetota bacterium]